jgi:hypothetical protein
MVEGILWDFAAYLNRRNICIYKTVPGGKKPRHLPYPWDTKTKQYSQKRLATGRPDYDHNPKHKLMSARHMLDKTRLGEYFHKELFDYLIGDFYDERNDLAHGLPCASRETAARAVLCLGAVLTTISRVVVDRGDDPT